MSVTLFLTGGTIDKAYNEIEESLVHSKTHIQRMLEQARSRVDIDIEELMLIDSADMTDAQREEIVQACKSTERDKIIITHGTATMAITSKLLSEHIQDKTIVLVGAMVPYMIGNSDALFNLGTAVAAVQTLDHGVYVTMNGKIFKGDDVTKDTARGEFITAA